jgi:hypothetical protein
LTPLTPHETAGYVAHKIELSGATVGTVITREAIDAIYRGTDGIPRLIDQLADQTLLLAAQERQRPISAALVGKAWGMLQQLPNPWSDPETIKGPEKSEATVAESFLTNEDAARPLPQFITAVQSAIGSQQYAKEVIPDQSISTSIQLKDILPSLERNLDGQDDIVEYGSLDENDNEYQLVPENEPDVEFAPTAPSAYEKLTGPTGNPTHPTNPTEVFGADFDEEFSLPVQSSPAYQTYSGIAFGNLRDENRNLAWEHTSPIFTIPEANEFLEARIPKPEIQQPSSETDWDDRETLDLEPTVEAKSITQSQAAFIEKQIEEEMREIVSELNMNAMMFDPSQPIDRNYQPSVSNEERSKLEPTDYTFDERSSYVNSPLSLADSAQSWEDETRDSSMFNAAFHATNRWDSDPMPTDQRMQARGDDRDILIIETESEPIRGSASGDSTNSARPVLHPYAKLFSNLR